MAQARVKIESASITETVVSPIWGGEFTYKKEKKQVFYRHEMKDVLALAGDDANLVKDLSNECERITVTVERFCEDEWQAYWQGFFTKFDCKFEYGGRDITQCYLEAKVTKDDAFECFYLEWEEKVNFYSNSSAIIVRPFIGTYEFLELCGFCANEPPPPCDDCDGGEGCLEYESSNVGLPGDPPCDPSIPYVKRICHRITATGTTTDPPPFDTGWTLLSGTTWWRCPGDPTAGQITISPLKYGRRWDDTLEFLVDELDCGLTLRSHFFGINATHDAPPDNIAYDFATAYCQDITIHRKSDVKRPDATNPSKEQVWTLSLRDVLADMERMFNVYWTIQGDDLILEHISYFEGLTGADYSDEPMEYSLEHDAETPRREFFYWSDENVSAFFRGFPIVYDCGNGDREHRVGLFTTDVEFIMSEANQEQVADENWVLVSNTIYEGGYYINNDGDLVNGRFRWQTLHANLFMHNRPFSTGTMNQEAAEFLSVQKLRQQPEFQVGLCCDEDFDPLNLITTLLGEGQITTATENIIAETLELNLNY